MMEARSKADVERSMSMEMIAGEARKQSIKHAAEQRRMDKRDQFAIAVLPKFMTTDYAPSAWAKAAYRVADAMMEERLK